MSAYYNERDPYAAEWLRDLIAADLIPPGFVDERDIRDIAPIELAGFVQCHFFAGIGVWALALRRAGWPDDRPVWTGSCPCQPFSAAGKRAGTADERHLWPHWFHLISQHGPDVILGEQVASNDGLGWLDLVSADLEAAGYAVASPDLCAAGFDGAHIRQRLYFTGLADALCDGAGHASGQGVGTEEAAYELDRCLSRERLRTRLEGAACRLAHANGRHSGSEWLQRGGKQRQQPQDGSVSRLGDAHGARTGRDAGSAFGSQTSGGGAWLEHGLFSCDASIASSSNGNAPAPVLGRDAVDWLFCTDGKWRPVGPGTFPLADAAPNRMGRLRAYGNALDLETATSFVSAVAHSAAFQIAEAA